MGIYEEFFLLGPNIQIPFYYRHPFPLKLNHAGNTTNNPPFHVFSFLHYDVFGGRYAQSLSLKGNVGFDQI